MSSLQQLTNSPDLAKCGKIVNVKDSIGYAIALAILLIKESLLKWFKMSKTPTRHEL